MFAKSKAKTRVLRVAHQDGSMVRFKATASNCAVRRKSGEGSTCRRRNSKKLLFGLVEQRLGFGVMQRLGLTLPVDGKNGFRVLSARPTLGAARFKAALSISAPTQRPRSLSWRGSSAVSMRISSFRPLVAVQTPAISMEAPLGLLPVTRNFPLQTPRRVPMVRSDEPGLRGDLSPL